MRRVAPVWTALLLLGTVARAQVVAALTDSDVLQAGTPPPSVSAAQPQPLSTPLRLGLEAGAGLVGGAAVGVFSAWAFSGLLNTQNNSAQMQRFTSLFGAPLGVAVGAPLAVTLTGFTLGEQGSFLVSWLSSMGGLAVGGSVYLVSTAASDSQAAKATYGLALLLPVVGAVLGYELSARAADSQPPAPMVAPTLFLTPGGGGGAVAGRF